MEHNLRRTDTIKLRQVMIERGYLTVQSLSRASGINRNTLGDILSGKAQPTYGVMNKIITTLDLSDIQAGQIFFATDLRDA